MLQDPCTSGHFCSAVQNKGNSKVASHIGEWSLRHLTFWLSTSPMKATLIYFLQVELDFRVLLPEVADEITCSGHQHM